MRVVTTESSGYEPYTPSDPETLRASLKPGDVLLVEGNQHVSAAIKYLTQSSWSHAAVYVGDRWGGPGEDLIEATIEAGCEAVPLAKYSRFNTRICRPVGLAEADRDAIITHLAGSIGRQYDLKNILDLARYLFPTPPVPVRWRRRMIAFGSGDPTQAICSSLIAEAFQSVRYPILPNIDATGPGEPKLISSYSRDEILHIRHHSLFAPRDFDLSPYFRVVKPTIERGFDYKTLVWEDPADESGPA